MNYRIQYAPLAHALDFEVRIHQEQLDNQVRQESRLGYGLRLQPLTKTGWGPFGIKIQKILPAPKANAADQLVQRLGEPLAELEVLLDQQGQLLKLRNHKAIWEKWMQLEEEIALSYRGEWVAQRVGQTESLLLLPESVLEVGLKQDWVLGEYFAQLYSQDFNYYTHQCRTESKSYHFLGPQPILLQEQWQYAPTPTGCVIAIEGTGKIPAAEKKKLIQTAGLQASELPVAITKKGSYQMEKDSSWCSGYTSTHSLTIGEVYQKQITIRVEALPKVQ